MKMTLGSLFDGAGTIPFAAQLCGITPVWSSEIEKFPCEVTAKRFPNMKQLECCRLQGMPDWWCADIPHSDAQEYRIWGNGMALPNALYIMEGLAKSEE